MIAQGKKGYAPRRQSVTLAPGFGLTKRGFNAAFANDLDTQLGLEEELQAEAGRTADYAEGVQAFIEKRPPRFKGC